MSQKAMVSALLGVLVSSLAFSACSGFQSKGPLLVKKNADAFELPPLMLMTFDKTEKGKIEPSEIMFRARPLEPLAGGRTGTHWLLTCPDETKFATRFRFLDRDRSRNSRILVQLQEELEGEKGTVYRYSLARVGATGELLHFEPTKKAVEAAKTSPHLKAVLPYCTVGSDTVTFDEIAVVKYEPQILDFFRSLEAPDMWKRLGISQASNDERLYEAMVKKEARLKEERRLEEQAHREAKARDEAARRAVAAGAAREKAKAARPPSAPAKPAGTSIRRLLAAARPSTGPEFLGDLKKVKLIVDTSKAGAYLDEREARRVATEELEKRGITVDADAIPVLGFDLVARGATLTTKTGYVEIKLTGFAVHSHASLLLPTFLFEGGRVWFGTTSPLTSSVGGDSYEGVHPTWTSHLIKRNIQELFTAGIKKIGRGSPRPIPEESVLVAAMSPSSKLLPIPRGAGFDVSMTRDVPGSRPTFSYLNFYSASQAANDFAGFAREQGLRTASQSLPRFAVHYFLRQDRVDRELLGRRQELGMRAVIESVWINATNALVVPAPGTMHWIDHTSIASYTTSEIKGEGLPTVTDERARIRARAARVAHEIGTLTN